MKLALIRRQYAATGGAEQYLQRLLEALGRKGHELHLYAETWDPVPAGVTLHPVPASGGRAQRPVRFAQAVDQALAGEDYDCVFSLERTLRQDVYRAGDGLHRVWLERRRQCAPWWRKPFVGWGAFHRNMRALEAAAFDPARTRHVIVNSEMVRQEILEHFRFPLERLHLVRNGVDVDRCRRGQREATRQRFGVGRGEFLLLFVGSGWERKGLAYILEALRVLSPDTFKLLVVGKGDRPAATPGNVLFAGPMADVENAYAAADLLVFPPIYEPSANVVFEALAAGLPVVTSAWNGAKEVLTPSVNGIIVEDPANPNELAAAICYWQMRPHARPVPTGADLSLRRNVAETIAVLELAAAEKKRSPR